MTKETPHTAVEQVLRVPFNTEIFFSAISQSGWPRMGPGERQQRVALWLQADVRGQHGMAKSAGIRRDETATSNAKSATPGLVGPVAMVLGALLLITIVKELACVMWRRRLMRAIDRLRANQEVFVNAGDEREHEATEIESGRWAVKFQGASGPGRRQRYTSMMLRVNREQGTFQGTGHDSMGECVVEGFFNSRCHRIAWVVECARSGTRSATYTDLHALHGRRKHILCRTENPDGTSRYRSRPGAFCIGTKSWWPSQGRATT